MYMEDEFFKKQAETDQAIASVGYLYPSLWWNLYQGCKDKGFSETQAMELVKAYILSIGKPS